VDINEKEIAISLILVPRHMSGNSEVNSVFDRIQNRFYDNLLLICLMVTIIFVKHTKKFR